MCACICSTFPYPVTIPTISISGCSKPYIMANESSIPGSPKNNTFSKKYAPHEKRVISNYVYEKASISMQILEWIMFYKILKGTSVC